MVIYVLSNKRYVSVMNAEQEMRCGEWIRMKSTCPQEIYTTVNFLNIMINMST